MSLSASLRIGNSALTASQQAIQTTGQNLANAATPGYARQSVRLAPIPGPVGTSHPGRGVLLQSISRQVDSAVQTRLWNSFASENFATEQARLFADLEASLGELSEHDLTSQLASFFNVWSERAGLSETSAVVVQQADQLAAFLRQMRADLVEQRNQTDRVLASAVTQADNILSQIADLNRQITVAEGAGGTASALRDQRDILVSDLSALMDVSVTEQPNGAYDILVGSTAVVLGARSLGLSLQRTTAGDSIELSVRTGPDGTPLTIQQGRIGALLQGRTQATGAVIDRLDQIAATLIHQTNRLHATGTNLQGLASTSSTLTFDPDDITRALNDPDNASTADLPFPPTNGGFFVHVTNTATGTSTVHRIDVDLDGIDDDGLASYDDDTSLQDIADQLDAIPGLSASISAEGRLSISAQTGIRFAFADDSSDALAALGVNAFFTGSAADDIAVRSDLKASPSLLMTGRIENGAFVENGTALAIAQLRDTTLAALGDESILSAWTATVQDVAGSASAAATRADAASLVRENVQAQRDAVSGVNIDEEAINLMTYQRQYQGAARFISAVDQLTQELIALI